MTELQQAEQPQEVDRKDLKIQALLDDITQTRNQNAEYRVEVTMLGQQLQQVWNQLQEANAKVAELEEGVSVPKEAAGATAD